MYFRKITKSFSISVELISSKMCFEEISKILIILLFIISFVMVNNEISLVYCILINLPYSCILPSIERL